MKHPFLGSTIISGLILFAVPGLSQDRDRDDDRYHNEDRDEHYWAGRLFDRVRADLDHIQATTPAYSSDEFGLARTTQKLNELQRDAAAGRFSQDRDVDNVIFEINRVLNDNRNQMPPRDRRMLEDDLNKLRDYKEHQERYYPRG